MIFQMGDRGDKKVIGGMMLRPPLLIATVFSSVSHISRTSLTKRCFLTSRSTNYHLLTTRFAKLRIPPSVGPPSGVPSGAGPIEGASSANALPSRGEHALNLFHSVLVPDPKGAPAHGTYCAKLRIPRLLR